MYTTNTKQVEVLPNASPVAIEILPKNTANSIMHSCLLPMLPTNWVCTPHQFDFGMTVSFISHIHLLQRKKVLHNESEKQVRLNTEEL